MKVFYQCYGRSHTSIVAAHLHLGHLPRGGPPSIGEIMSLPFFDRAKEEDLGRPLAMGRDENGHDIYAVGYGLAPKTAMGAAFSLFRLADEKEQLLMVGTLQNLGFLARLGGGLSRQLGLIFVGRPLAAYGVRAFYPRLEQIVVSVKAILKEMQSLDPPPGPHLREEREGKGGEQTSDQVSAKAHLSRRERGGKPRSGVVSHPKPEAPHDGEK